MNVVRSGWENGCVMGEHIVMSIRKAGILEAALFTRQRASVYAATHGLEAFHYNITVIPGVVYPVCQEAT
jgi:hypothetical protein